MSTVENDPVNKPAHYRNHASGVECIEVTRAMSFDLGNAFKYVFRHGDKGKPIEDLNKALWYLDDARRGIGFERPDTVDAKLLEMSVKVGRIFATEPNENIGNALVLIWQAEAQKNRTATLGAAEFIRAEIARLEAQNV